MTPATCTCYKRGLPLDGNECFPLLASGMAEVHLTTQLLTHTPFWCPEGTLHHSGRAGSISAGSLLN